MNISQQIREEIPSILKKIDKEITFNQLFDELLKIERDGINKSLKDEFGENRIGVLRGVINSHLDGTIIIKNLNTYKNGRNRYFKYDENMSKELKELQEKRKKYKLYIQDFINKIECDALSNESLIRLNDSERKWYLEMLEKVYDLKKMMG